ncbi:hypothetical protein ACS0TY_017056 [Phlomoides rotata]
MHVMMRSPVIVVKFKNYETLVTNWKSVSSEADNGSIRTSKDLESASKLPPLRLNYLNKISFCRKRNPRHAGPPFSSCTLCFISDLANDDLGQRQKNPHRQVVFVI